MRFIFSETVAAVQEYLNSINVKYAFNYVGPVDSKEWAHDLFTVSFVTAGKEPLTTEYKTGFGHRLNRTKKGGPLNMMKFDPATGRQLGAHREALGGEIMDQLPAKIPPAATEYAAKLRAMIEANHPKCKGGISRIYEICTHLDPAGADRELRPELFGHYRAMQSMGHGVGLECFGDEVSNAVRVPYLEGIYL